MSSTFKRKTDVYYNDLVTHVKNKATQLDLRSYIYQTEKRLH